MTAMKTWTRDEINALLLRNPKAVERAVVVLFERQTADEKRVRHTKWDNKRGFAVWAAKSGSRIAAAIQAGRPLSEADRKTAMRIALVHSRQLVEEANRPKAAVSSAAA